jgi:hypothetical protein
MTVAPAAEVTMRPVEASLPLASRWFTRAIS